MNFATHILAERGLQAASICERLQPSEFCEPPVRSNLKRHKCRVPGWGRLVLTCRWSHPRNAWAGGPHPGASGGRSAFSLVEVMIAVVILAIAVVGLTQGFTTALESSKDSELQTTAALFAAGQIETLRAETGLTDGTTEGDCGEDLPLYRWRQTVTAGNVDGLHEVSVVVQKARTGESIYELKTLLFEVPGTEADKSKKAKSAGDANS